jgi:uncharacterized lipoprotein YajG
MNPVERWKRGRQAILFLLVVPAALVALVAACSSLPTPVAVSPLAPAPSRDPLDLTIVHSNDTWGYLTPCG